MIGPPPEHEPEPGWHQSLSQGAPGIMLLHIARARAATAPWTTVHSWAAASLRNPVSAHPGTGLFYGVTAVAFALSCAGQPGYDPPLNDLDDQITKLIHRRLNDAHERIDRAEPPALAEYDLISGLTGLGRYLLHRHDLSDNGSNTSGDQELLRAVLDYLVRLTRPQRPRILDVVEVPGWWSGHDQADCPSPDLPQGHANLGLAHGITGPLALLAITMRRGIIVDGQAEAIERICRWLDTWKQGHGIAAWWPERITAEQHRTGHCDQTAPARPSWCYGTPGLARAQQLAALALDDPQRQQAAENALLGSITDPRQLQRLTDPSLCHGWAGLLLTTTRAAADARNPTLTEQLPALHDQFSRHPAPPPATPGLLLGAAGIELVRNHPLSDVAASTTTDAASNPPAWDACLLTHG